LYATNTPDNDSFVTPMFYSGTDVCGIHSSVVAKTLYNKPEGRVFETRWGQWFFATYLILLAALGPGVYSDSNRNECQKQKNNVSGE
jgi:hypothetical protein